MQKAGEHISKAYKVADTFNLAFMPAVFMILWSYFHCFNFATTKFMYWMVLVIHLIRYRSFGVLFSFQ